MSTSPLQRPASVRDLSKLAAAELLDPPQLEQALRELGRRPTRAQWIGFLRLHLAGIGAAMVVVGTVSFVAANWSALGHVARLLIVAGGMIGSTLLGGVLGLHTLSGRFAALVGGLLYGPVLVVYSQMYQTGADSWTLFAQWALIMTGYGIVTRFLGAWVVWLVLLHVTCITAWGQLVGSELGQPRAWPLAVLLVAMDAGVVGVLHHRGRAAGLGRVAHWFGTAIVSFAGAMAILEHDHPWARAIVLGVAGLWLLTTVWLHHRARFGLVMAVPAVLGILLLTTIGLAEASFTLLRIDDLAAAAVLLVFVGVQVWGWGRWLMAKRGR